jgi:hypothetical protein
MVGKMALAEVMGRVKVQFKVNYEMMRMKVLMKTMYERAGKR